MRTFLTVATALGLLALAVPTHASAQTASSQARAAKATPASIAKSTKQRRHGSRATHKVLRDHHRDYHAYGYRARHHGEWRFSPSNVGYQGR